jgi:hypothetical protein
VYLTEIPATVQIAASIRALNTAAPVPGAAPAPPPEGNGNSYLNIPVNRF